MSRPRLVAVVALGSAVLAVLLVVSLPVVRWSVTLLALWIALAAGLACRASWRAAAARWSWRLGTGLLEAGRGPVRDVDLPATRDVRLAARAVTGAVSTVLSADRRVVVERCRQLSPGVRATLLVAVLGVAFLALSAFVVFGLAWALRRLGALAARARVHLTRAGSRLETGLARSPGVARWYSS